MLPADAEFIISNAARRLNISGSNVEIISLIDDWWFVPRCAQGKDLWKKRMPQTIALYEKTGMLPAYFREAYEFLVSDQYREILETIASADNELSPLDSVLAA